MRSTGIVFDMERPYTLPPFDPWGWAKYVDITIAHDEVPGDVKDFPLCIQGDDMPAGFWAAVQADGGDCVVTLAGNRRRLHQELEYIDVGTTKLALHTKVPSISKDYDTILRVYYSNAGADVGKSPLTWDPYYSFVSHMADKLGDATMILDSTVNANHGTKGAGAAAPTEVAGTVGRAQQFVAASGQYINVADVAGLNITGRPLTLLALLKPDADAATCYLVARNTSGGDLQYGLGWTPNYVRVALEISIRAQSAANSAPVAVWSLGSARWTADGTVQMFVNGAPSGSAVSFTSALTTRTTISIGRRVDGAYFKGGLCELRLASVARTAEWIALEHKTLLTPTVLYGISAEQSV
jgi:hypothetical protein